MPTSSSGRESRRNSKPNATANGSVKSSGDRRQKAQSTEVYTGRRRPSQQADNGTQVYQQRPEVKTRTNSAPLVQTINEPGLRNGLEKGDKISNSELDLRQRIADVNAVAPGQDEDEVAGVVGTIKHFEPFQSPRDSKPLPDINIAVIGAEHVGKSSFTQNALDLPFKSDSRAIERKIEIESNDYLLRMLEISIDDVDIDDDDTVSWPETIEDKFMPRIDGVLTLYDVKDQTSLENIPEMLNAISKAELPSLLVACKCDAPPEERDINPRVIEQTAKRRVKGLDTHRVSTNAPQSHKEGVSMILQAVVSGASSRANNNDDVTRNMSPSRRRAQSSAVTSASIHPQNDRGHLRAASEHTGSIYKEKLHAKHDSKLAGYNSSDRLQVHDETTEDEMRGSFLIEESSSEASDGASRSSEDVEIRTTTSGSKLDLSDNEEGSTFEELVERLLKQPISKADGKFVAIFLALYRKFATPGQLLEALVQRFDDLDSQRDGSLVHKISQLRYLAVLEQWLGTYPGDFAFPKTYRRIRTFVGKLAQTRMFAAAAKEMSAHLNGIRDDDDTHWAYCDKDRADASDLHMSLSSTASVLIDDPTFLDGFLLAPTPMEDDEKTLAGSEREPSGSMSSSLSQHIASAEIAQQQANLLQPIPRQAMTKIQWRALMDFPDEAVARELTRIDWILFSAIRPRDLVRHVSLNKHQKVECKNLVYVDRMVDHFNQLAFWVENFILLRDKPKHRALMLEKFMRIARKLREINNYNSLGAIIAGIKSSAVHRLAMTRELLPPAVGKDWMKIEILMAASRSYAAYRLAWENSSSERIPYIPLHRRDLVSAESGNKTFIGHEKEGKINWKKFEVMGEVIVSMQKAQSMPYKGLNDTRGKEQLKELILDVKLVKDEDELHARSKQLEPSGTPAMGTTAKFKELFKR